MKNPRQLVAICWAAIVGGFVLALLFEDPSVFVTIAITAITAKGAESGIKRYRRRLPDGTYPTEGAP